MSAFRPLYDWALRQAQKPYAAALLFCVAMVEPCLVPIPPDTLLIPMIIARREKAYIFATICTLGSIIGGVMGYGIGALAMATLGQWIVDTYHLQAAFKLFSDGFQKWGALIILLKGITPIPFMLVSVASGVTHLNLGVFVLSASITRGGRFFFEAFLIRRYGRHVQEFIERYLTWIGLGVLTCIVGGVWVVVR